MARKVACDCEKKPPRPSLDPYAGTRTANLCKPQRISRIRFSGTSALAVSSGYALHHLSRIHRHPVKQLIHVV